MKAAHDLGYRPNRVAKALREGSSRIVLINTGPERAGHSLESFIEGFEQELRQHNFALVVTHGGEDGKVARTITDAIAPRAVLNLAELYTEGSPNTGLEGGWATGMASHALLQLGHLHQRGHTKIAFALPKFDALPKFVNMRQNHILEAAHKLGMAEPYILTLPGSREAAAHSLAALRNDHPDITAIACYNDDVALLALSAMASLNMKVPDELAVIGFDESPHAQLWFPRLTTIRINTANHGRRLARLTLGLDAHSQVFEPSVVVAGESV